MIDRRRDSDHRRRRLPGHRQDDSVAWAPILFGAAFLMGLGIIVFGGFWNHPDEGPRSETSPKVQNDQPGTEKQR